MSIEIRTTLMILLSFHPAAAQNATEEQVQPPPATYSALPSEIPEKFEPRSELLEYDRREEKIPMRDGVRLHTVILVPKGSENAPILLT
ncbi:MAG: glutaryl-7-ACA acylase, partial [Thermoanaerobaculia bacterium]